MAVSGGADSIFLLHFLVERGGVPLTVLHVNHGLRGMASDADCAFVAEIAEALGLPMISHRMGPVSGNLEQFCRRERKAFFERVIAEGRVDRVVTGHTASDQAETVLMRLLRGAGTTGLRGVLPVTAEGLIRPLLAVGRDEIRDWLRERGIAWREDESNASDQFLRNRVRAKLLPVMRELDPAVESALERVAELAAVDEDFWRREAGGILDRIGDWNQGGLVLDCRKLAELHPALLGRVLRLALERALGGLRRLDRAHLERVGSLVLGAAGDGAVEVPRGRVERSMDWIRVGGSIPAPLEGEIPGEFTGLRFELKAWLEDEGGYTEGEAIVLDWERLRPPVRLRAWKAGDRFQAAGAMQEKLVKQFFEQTRIPSWDRALWPIITDSEGIVWIHRLGAAARALPQSGTRIRLRVRCDTVSSK